MLYACVLSAGLLTLVASSTMALASERGLERFQPADVFQLEWASDPRISPSGKRVVYVRNSMDVMTDRRRASVWSLNTDGSDQRPLLSGAGQYSSARLSPDGKRVLYLSTQEGSTQLYVRWLDTGQTAQLTNVLKGPSNPVWSPNGKRIAFTMFVPRYREPLAKPPVKPKNAEWAPQPKAIESVHYRSDGQGSLEEGHSHLFLLPATGGTPRQLTQGDYNHVGEPVWLPQNSGILITANRSPDWEYEPRGSEIYKISLEGEIKALTDRNGPDTSPTLSPDGSSIAYTGFDDEGLSYQPAHLYLMDRDGGNQRTLAAQLDRSVSSPQWAPDGEGIYVMYGDRGLTRVALVTLEGQIRNLVDDVGGLALGRPYGSGSFHVGKVGIVYTSTGTQAPSEVTISNSRGKTTRLTHLNDDLLGHKTLGRVERMTYRSPVDNREIEGWIMTPPGFDPGKKYPLILEIHGGPYAYYGPYFAVELQLMAAKDYVVLYVNPRGSTSYGIEFANLIHQKYPSQDYDDLMAGVDATIRKGFVDPRQLYVTGGSGGGVLTAWIVGKTNRFRAAVASKPVINWISAAGTSDIYLTFLRYWMPAPFWEDFETYWKYSPLSLVGNVTTPTMLLTGESDYRTPISETEQYYQALKARKIDTAMVRIPEASHGIIERPSHLIAKVNYSLAWFERYRSPE